jgi:hypothetical protein
MKTLETWSLRFLDFRKNYSACIQTLNNVEPSTKVNHNGKFWPFLSPIQ